eukprot:gnl/Dysnectes_brevis/246_a277_4314.p1 GENE.gnl/Dysnectes_brevis/246_a277_4314~~gnl/Dysnectes_brevis/246_a277_4314.p1  ORF type:complete len:302 (+),score=61.52 gnl/Dysnectes_brevis/246_a277_4314:69-974(+)
MATVPRFKQLFSTSDASVPNEIDSLVFQSPEDSEVVFWYIFNYNRFTYPIDSRRAMLMTLLDKPNFNINWSSPLKHVSLLHCAVKFSTPEVAAILIQRGTRQEQKCLPSDNTPLFSMVETGHPDRITCMYLAQMSATINIPNRAGKLPIAVLLEKGLPYSALFAAYLGSSLPSGGVPPTFHRELVAAKEAGRGGHTRMADICHDAPLARTAQDAAVRVFRGALEPTRAAPAAAAPAAPAAAASPARQRASPRNVMARQTTQRSRSSSGGICAEDGVCAPGVCCVYFFGGVVFLIAALAIAF